MIKHINKFTLFTLLFLLPTQLALHFWPAWAFVFGIRIDLLAPALYLTDILIFILVTLNFKIFQPYYKYIVVLIALAAVNCLFSTSPSESIYRWLKVFEFALFAIFIVKQNIFKIETIIKTLFYSSVFFSLIGIFQFLKNNTIGGLLYWLGERSFNIVTPGIALVSLNGVEHLRAYSTFSHPNSLAGFLGAILIFALLSGILKRNISNILCVVVISACFFLTFSLSAYFGLLVVLFFVLFFRKEKIFTFSVLMFIFISVLSSLLLTLFSPAIISKFGPFQNNINERFNLAHLAGLMISKNFLFGLGLGTFIINIPGLQSGLNYLWLLQPVHNIFLLVFSETGIIGLLGFCLFIYKIIKKSLSQKKINLVLTFLFIIFTALTDHYWLTLQQNFLLFSLLIGLALR